MQPRSAMNQRQISAIQIPNNHITINYLLPELFYKPWRNGCNQTDPDVIFNKQDKCKNEKNGDVSGF